ncbi:hypothetical protein [Cohaesibacter celericrescens]|uniref:DUF2933 domain-containing protein n=1 Tax=Cohaesibacter celericrescens TaxID=2067669 RepID=A0A2N5XK03_9HYPH|nr:hypothetical protein [Cohaesibacter celericrescens]PLW74825.1 hypothetical protein C0081_21110 [Cohaesibacter celericrescens]
MTDKSLELTIPSVLGRLIPKTGHGWIMTACCALMFTAAGFALLGAESQSLSSIVWGMAPIGGCLAMHSVMHKFMGKSCHEDHKDTSSKSGGGHE